MAERRVVVTGAGGFVGRHVCAELERRGWNVLRVAGRSDADLGDPSSVESLRARFERAQAVVHLVGIIVEVGANTYEQAHVRATRHALGLARGLGAERFVHMSALGTRPDARARYHQTKWQAETLVRTSGLEWTIFRPSLIFGADGEFVQMMRKMARIPFAVPVVAPGTFVQPVFVDDVARMFADALENPETIGRVCALGGPRAYRMREVVDLFVRAECGHPKWLLPVPRAAVWPAAWLFEMVLRRPPVTRDQLIMLGEDNVCEIQETWRIFRGRLTEFGAWLESGKPSEGG
jgi:NADH dehydrogenase